MKSIRQLVSKHQELLLFGAAGALGYLVDVSITSLAEQLLGVYIARVPAFFGAATATWLFNRSLTFKERKSKHKTLLKEYQHYIGLMIFGLVVNYIAYAASITLLKDKVDLAIPVCVAIGSLAGFLVNFFTSRRYLFNETKKITAQKPNE